MVIVQRIMALAAVGSLVALQWSCIGSFFPEPTRYRVQYRVEGTAVACTVSYSTAFATEVTNAYVELPWSYVFKPKCGMWLRLRAFKLSGDNGSLVGSIHVDGAVTEMSDSIWAPYGIDLIQWLDCPN